MTARSLPFSAQIAPAASEARAFKLLHAIVSAMLEAIATHREFQALTVRGIPERVAMEQTLGATRHE